jgi:type VII secretion integral membrane protein EccD
LIETGNLCRVTLIAPRVRLDIALPAAVPLAALLPTLLWHSGEQLADEGLPHGGWALQRVGDAPLDTSRTLTALGVRDGDVLHLRPRQEALPTPVFDDTVDAISTALRERARRWGPAATRIASLAAIGLVLAAGAAALAVSAVPRVAGASLSAAVAIAAVLAAAAASRALGDAPAGTVLGLAGLPYAFLAGLRALPPGTARVAGHAAAGQAAAGQAAAGHLGLTPAGFLVGCTALLVMAAFGGVAVGDGASMLTGAVVAGFIGVACSLLALGTSAAGAGAVAVSAALALSPAIAPVAYRVARLPQPTVPTTPEELRQRSEPVNFAEVSRQSVTADRVVGALVAATGVVAVTGLAIALARGNWAAEVLAAVASGLLLLRARVFSGVVQRAWLIGSGLASVVMLAVLAAARTSSAGALVIVGGSLVITALLVGVVASPGRRMAPSLGRMTDLLELLATLATIPLALELLHVYSLVRSLGG